MKIKVESESGETDFENHLRKIRRLRIFDNWNSYELFEIIFSDIIFNKHTELKNYFSKIIDASIDVKAFNLLNEIISYTIIYKIHYYIGFKLWENIDGSATSWDSF